MMGNPRMNQGIHYAVISHHRPHNVANMMAVTTRKDLHWYVGDDEAEDYESAGAESVVEVGNLVEARNRALNDAFLMAKPCMMLDDDLRKCEIVRNGTEKRQIGFNDLVNEMQSALYQLDVLRLCGISATTNLFYHPGQRYSMKHFIIASCMLVKPNPLRFDTQFTTKEDYDYTLQHIQKYGGVIRCNDLMPTFGHYTNRGGVVEYRTPEVEQENIRKLKAKWGKSVRDNPRRPNEILLHVK